MPTTLGERGVRGLSIKGGRGNGYRGGEETIGTSEKTGAIVVTWFGTSESVGQRESRESL